MFATTCENPPDEFLQLKRVLRARAMEEDRNLLQATSAAQSFTATLQNERVDEAIGYYVDRNLKRKNNARPMKGYGHGKPSGARHKVPSDVCIVCFKKGCHSSHHKKRMKAYMAVLAAESSESSSSDNDADEQGDESYDNAVGFQVTMCRALAYMGMKPGEDRVSVCGGVIDTGSSILSTIGEALVVSASAVSAIETHVKRDNDPFSLDGISITVETRGTLQFSFVFGGKMYNLKLYIILGTSPMLICHRDMDRFGLNYQTLKKTITRKSDSYIEKATMINGVPYLMFSFPSYFSAQQLRNIHRNLGHPSVEKQIKVIEAAGVENLSQNTRSMLKKLVEHCHACQLSRAKPRRFLFSVKDSITGEFNHVLEIDVMKLRDGNVLHVLCSGTRFQQGLFIDSMTALEAWKTLRRCWIDVYAGAPDIIKHDHGTNFQSKEFQSLAGDMGICIKCVPAEAHERIGSLERRHAVVRSIYSKMALDLPDIGREERLSLTFRAINDVPDRITGICPTTLVFENREGP